MIQKVITATVVISNSNGNFDNGNDNNNNKMIIITNKFDWMPDNIRIEKISRFLE